MKKVFRNVTRRTLALLLSCVMLAGCLELPALAAAVDPSSGLSNSTELRLWYDKPATQTISDTNEDQIWQQATLPIGNGDLGANIYGEIATERLTLNEKTFWVGGPSESRPNYMGGNIVSGRGENGATMTEIQEKFLSGDESGARSLTSKLTGGSEFNNSGYGYYAPWGELRIAYSGVTSADSGTYQRWLSLDDALAGVRFQSGGVTYSREYLVSHPDNVLAVRLTATSAMNLTITLPGSTEAGGASAATVVGNDTLRLSGSLSDNQLKFASFLKVVPANGTVTGSGSSLSVSGATEVTMFFSAATDYKNDYPLYRTGETDGHLTDRVKAVVDAAAVKGYSAVRTDHIADYVSLYDRMTLDLGQASTNKTTDALLAAYNNGSASEAERRLLEVILFQYGRYLTIASSREDSQLPSNLQGVWNNRTNPPWHSDYHANVNLQMNYWPTYSTNLTECADPLIRYIDSLREPGRVTAQVYAGIESTSDNPENGFMAHTQNTPFGWTCPGWSFDWGWSPAAMPWMLQNCWEYYEYTGDLDYMRNNIYPMLKEEARLYDQLLIDINSDPNVVELATVPAYSPEHGPATMGNTYEQSLVWQLYEDAITAAELLGDTQYIETWKYNQDHLKGPIEIGTEGQIKEWYHETGISKDENGATIGQGNGHRHLSHMLGLFPGDLVQTNEEWVEAARVSMNARVDQSTGWGMGQRINTWARLRDGNHAYDLIKYLFSSGMYKNLWDAHPPFQIDGNFGYTAGVVEMLMQSNMGFIDLLPALPDAWTSGSFEGVITRGNFELSAQWANGAMTTVDITSHLGGECVVRCDNLSRAVVKDSAGNLIQFEVIDADKISFNTVKGQTYTISEFPAGDISTVENAVAYRTEDDAVDLSWTAKDGESYQVYRQIEDGEILPVGGAITTGSYHDAPSYASLGEMRYYISVNGAGLSSAIKVQDLRDMTRVDDQYSLDGSNPTGTPIVYTGSWGTYNYNSSDYKTTCRFVEAGDVNGQTASLTFLGTGIQARGRGYSTRFTMAIDGGTAQAFTSSNSADRDQVLGEITGLEYGIHTVVLTLTGNKIDFDGFNVLGSGKTESPVELSIRAVGGVEKLWAAGDTVQFTANLDGVTWSLSSDHTHGMSCAAANNHVAAISASGLLTAGRIAETVTVTATLGSQTASKTIEVSPNPIVTVIEDAVNNSPNPAISWTGSWGTWAGESDRHHGGTKTENGTSFSYTFNGTGIAVFAQKNLAGGGMQISIDGTDRGTYSLYDSGSGADQFRLAEFLDLSDGQHTITCTGVTQSGRSGVNLDFLEIYNTNANTPTVDLTALKAAVSSCDGLNESSYSAESWAVLESALATAAAILNGTTAATEQNVAAAVAAINAARNALAPKTLTAPAHFTAIQVEGSSVVLKWDPVDGAASYEITIGGRTVTVETTIYRVAGLESGTSYTFEIRSKNAGGTSATASTVTAITLDTVAPEKVENLTWNAGTGTLSWTASSDNVAVTGYRVLVDGTAQQDESTALSRTLSLASDAQHTVQVIALDAAGNESIPNTLVIAPTYTVTVTNGVLAGGQTSGSFRAGEAVSVTATIPEGHVLTAWQATGIILSGNTADLSFAMPARNVTLNARTEEKFWPVSTNLTNLTSSLTSSQTVRHGGNLSFTLSPAEDYYNLPDSIRVTVGGKEVTSPYGAPALTYNSATGAVSITGIDGNVVITAANAAQTPAGDSYTESDPFILPSRANETAKLEAEHMALDTTGAVNSSSRVQRSAGPGFNNQHITNFLNGNKLILYYNAPVSGTYTITLNYWSSRDVNNLHTLNWRGDKVVDRAGAITNTLDNGTAVYATEEFQFTVTEAGPGTLEFYADSQDSPDIDWITFQLDAALNPVTSVTLDKTSATLYSNTGDANHTVALTATVLPEDADDKELVWRSSNPNVASVNQNGLVTAVSAGTATITATAMDGSGVHADCLITVKTTLSGTVNITGDAKFGATLTASLNQLSPQEAKDSLSYQWNRNGTPITGATGDTYVPAQGDIGGSITVTVTANGFYEGTATSAPVTITKADGPAVTANLNHVDCTTSDNNDGKIVGLNSFRLYQYKLFSADTWIDVPAESTEIIGLVPGDYVVRVAETATHTAGPNSRTVTILGYDESAHVINIADSFVGGVVRVQRRRPAAGTVITIYVTPDPGYRLAADSLKVTGASGADIPVSADYTFTMPDEDVTITARFELNVCTIEHNLTHISCDMVDHNHTVDYGAMPIITLIPDEGYDLPSTITITTKNDGSPFFGYTYRYGVIAFNQGITEDLVITGAGVLKSHTVTYELTRLSAIGQPGSVDRLTALTFTITPDDGYALPERDGIVITMGGNPFTDFTYDQTTGVVSIPAGKITGNLVVSATGVRIAAPLTGVSISGTAEVGQRLTATVTPAGATASYQWIRVDGSTETNIPGATFPRYVLTTADAGKIIKVAATGTGSYSGTVVSEGTAPVADVPVVPVTSITLDPTGASLMMGSQLTLTATVAPEDATNKTVLWTSSDSTVASVDSQGRVTALKPGTAVITAATVSGNQTATCVITVTGVTLDRKSATITVGSTLTLTATLPTSVSYNTVLWSSDNNAVAAVNTSGVVTGVSAGTAVITASAPDGSSSDQCIVTVAEATYVPSAPSTPPTTTTVTENGDGSTTTTVTDNRTGTVTITTEKTDGTVEVIEAKVDGTVTETTTDPQGGKVEKVTDPQENVAITVTDPQGKVLAEVEIPAEIPAPETTFVDVPEGHWAEESINDMAALGLVNGVGDRIYDMDSPMTRGALATVLSRLSNGKADADISFLDVAAGQWYSDGIAWAAQTGIVTGYSETAFGPNDTITREQLAVMLSRYAKLLGMNTTAPRVALGSFTDGVQTDAWAVDGVAWCIKEGILQGKGGNTLAPTATATRSEVAVMLRRFLELLRK